MRVIIPALNYADMLAVTLPAWRTFLPEAHISLVTGSASGDWLVAHRMADYWFDAFPAGAMSILLSEAWTRDGALFNKAAALQEDLVECADGELCVVADADTVPFGRFTEAEIEPGVLYGCARYRADDAVTLAAHNAGHLRREQLTLIPPRRGGEPQYGRWSPARAAAECTGYFHAFRYRPGLTFGSYPTAASYDLAFRRQFDRCVGLTDFYVLHLGELSRENWKGRVVPRWPAGASA